MKTARILIGLARNIAARPNLGPPPAPLEEAVRRAVKSFPSPPLLGELIRRILAELDLTGAKGREAFGISSSSLDELTDDEIDRLTQRAVLRPLVIVARLFPEGLDAIEARHPPEPLITTPEA